MDLVEKGEITFRKMQEIVGKVHDCLEEVDMADQLLQRIKRILKDEGIALTVDDQEDRIQNLMNTAIDRYVALALRMGDLSEAAMKRSLAVWGRNLKTQGIDLEPFFNFIAGRAQNIVEGNQ